MTQRLGTVERLFRFPFKSMAGEEIPRALVTSGGLIGDRGYAFVDRETGRIASAKHPGKWGTLLRARARFSESPSTDGFLPPVEVLLPDGTSFSSDDAEADRLLSDFLGREGSIATIAPPEPRLEMDWPKIDGLYRPGGTVTLEGTPEGAFFDVTPIHCLTSASLASLRDAAPHSDLSLRRFRPNLFLRIEGEGFVESNWVDRRLSIGDSVELRVAMESPRCIMTTVSQHDLPRDLEILRALARNNRSHLGVYAEVVKPGTIATGDSVALLDS